MNLYAWILASRPKTLIASIAPILCSVMIVPANKVNLSVLFATLFAGIFIQIGTNYINDLYDFLKGADSNNRVGPKRMVQSGKISQHSIKVGIITVFIIALICGIYLSFIYDWPKIKWPIILIGISSFCFGYLYTGGKYSLAYLGLGELFVFLYFGIIAVTGSYYLHTDKFFTKSSLLMGIIMGCANVILLVVNNIRDYHNDKLSHKKTLVVKYGQFFGQIEILIMFVIIIVCSYELCIYINSINTLFLLLLLSPLALIILYDVIYKQGIALNKTLFKTSIFILCYTLLFFYGTHYL
tara:strand:- start:354 stop:1244 length:891 start_codon:yes stop_codon:yes gene_type:complete